MGRAIKFRAWDDRHNSMEYIEDLFWFEENGMHNAQDRNQQSGNYQLMQYTGLHDKNGVEIYEGDIIRNTASYPRDHWMKKNMVLGSIIWNNEFAFFDVDRLPYVEDSTSVYKFSEHEVIGNIHENKELLDGND